MQDGAYINVLSFGEISRQLCLWPRDDLHYFRNSKANSPKRGNNSYLRPYVQTYECSPQTWILGNFTASKESEKKQRISVTTQNKTVLDKTSPYTVDQTVVLGMKTKVNNKAVLIYANELEALSNHSSVAKLRGSLYKCGLTLISRNVLNPNPS